MAELASLRGGFHIWPVAMGDPTQQRLAEALDEPGPIDIETLEVSGAAVPHLTAGCRPAGKYGSFGAEDVADDVPFLEVDDGLGDAGGVIGDPFQVARGVDQAKPGIEPLGIAADLVLEIGQDRGSGSRRGGRRR